MICNLLLVTRVFPFARASGDEPPFAKASGDEPPFARASGDKPHPPSRGARHPPPPQQGRWALVCSRRGLSSPPLEGCPNTGPHENAIFVGGWGGVVRDCGISHLLSCHSRARGSRKYEYVCGVDKAGILYPFSNNFCHSRAGGNRVY